MVPILLNYWIKVELSPLENKSEIIQMLMAISKPLLPVLLFLLSYEKDNLTHSISIWGS